jgi:dienelactone hydrolase
MNEPMKGRRLGRRIFKAFAVLALLAILGIAALRLGLGLEHRTDVTLPEPTGSSAVGRVLYDWKDDQGTDPMAPVAGTRRELLVWIWYPAAAGPPAVMDDYIPAAVRPAGDRQGGTTFLGLLTRDLSKVHGHSLRNAAVSPRERSYPVVLMRAGGSSEVVNYSTLAEDLASHGYVVVGFDAPYRTGRVVFPDGRVLQRTPANNPELVSGGELARLGTRLQTAWTADTRFVLDRLQQLNASDPSGAFTGRLDLNRVGAFGHSFGGVTALQFCHDDSRCKAGIDVDGAPIGSVIQTGVRVPFLFLVSDHGDLSADAEKRQIKADIDSIYLRLPVDGRAFLMIRGANHFTFSDDGALLKSRLMRGILRLTGNLAIDGRRQLAVTTYCVHSFFDACLKGAGPTPPNLPSPLYPELRALE